MGEKFETANTLLAENKEQIQEIAKINFKKWNDLLQTKDPNIVADLYAPGSTFLPTVSPDFKKGPEQASGYFGDFLKQKPDAEIIDEVVQALGDNNYLHSGMYNFEVGPDDNRQTIEARFSFVWQKNEQGQWQIIHHHSSMKPENE